MAKNVERILTNLQTLCDENFVECVNDFQQHESWLLGTFKTSALQKLSRPKVELACPHSAKKQRTSENLAEPAPVHVKPVDMAMDPAEEPQSNESDPTQVGAPPAAPDPGAAAKLAAAMAAAMGNSTANQSSVSIGAATKETSGSQPSTVQPMDTQAAISAPVAANAKPPKSTPTSLDNPHNQNGEHTTSHASSTAVVHAKPQVDSVPAAAERKPAPTPQRTLSATEQLSRLRQRLAGMKSGQTPTQPAQPGAWKQSAHESTLRHPVSANSMPAESVSPDWIRDMPTVEEAVQPPTDTIAAAAASESRKVDIEQSINSHQEKTKHPPSASSSSPATQTLAKRQQQQGVAKTDSTEKRNVDKLDHSDSVSKKAKLAASPQPYSAGTSMADQSQMAGSNKLSATPHAQKSGTEMEQKKAALVSDMTVEDKLAMAAARRQQMESEKSDAHRTKAKHQATGSTLDMDQSKKRPHPQDADAGTKRPKAPSATTAGAENMTVGTDKVLMPPPPPSASKKTPLKSPRSAYNNANSYATDMKQTASSSATPGPAKAKSSASKASASVSASSSKASASSSKAKTSTSGGGTESKKPKKVPEWAQGAKLQESLRGEQMYRDPDEIFGPVQMTCNLQEIFNSNKSKYKKRSSSGNWVPDRVTHQEERAYKMSAGYR